MMTKKRCRYLLFDTCVCTSIIFKRANAEVHTTMIARRKEIFSIFYSCRFLIFISLCDTVWDNIIPLFDYMHQNWKLLSTSTAEGIYKVLREAKQILSTYNWMPKFEISFKVCINTALCELTTIWYVPYNYYKFPHFIN